VREAQNSVGELQPSGLDCLRIIAEISGDIGPSLVERLTDDLVSEP
jgi:hypothetical protein